ncbi:MAG: hypothetical protein ABSG17_15955 [Spirochaetia bacterium]|jgi:hypothetical protein
MSLLLAILAPGSVEAEIGRVQERIFTDHGLVSSIALPPLVPVSFLSEAAPLRGLLSKLNRGVAAPYRISVAGLLWHDGWLYLAVDSGGLWRSLRAAAPGEAAGPFAVFEGFFLGCEEAGGVRREEIRPPLPAIGFTSSTLAVVRIDAGSPGTGWWRDVSTEVVDEMPLRGRRG